MIPRGISGVYKITNIVTKQFYIGASVDIDMRWTTHMGRDARKYRNHPFYIDIRKFGKENFELEILEECKKEDLLPREQFYFDELYPQYNIVRPAINNFKYEEIRIKAIENSNTPELVQKRKEKYNSSEYKEYFRHVHKDKMRPVDMYLNNVLIKHFISMQEASRYITETTDFIGKNKTSKIKAVCDGERNTAYGFSWMYSKV